METGEMGIAVDHADGIMAEPQEMMAGRLL